MGWWTASQLTLLLRRAGHRLLRRTVRRRLVAVAIRTVAGSSHQAGTPKATRAQVAASATAIDAATVQSSPTMKSTQNAPTARSQRNTITAQRSGIGLLRPASGVGSASQCRT